MARSRSAKHGQASAALPPWPLDPPRDPSKPRARALLESSDADTYFCRSCGRGVRTERPPDGWYRLQVHDAAQEHRDGRTFLTTGLFCRLSCLAAWATAETTR